ncbi:DUF342 domain-containing protein [Marinospirillum alkaliphilum]|uniref:Flagellar Assembly Protein A N-terminal region domain-containing protein n=1 Tax=Marinospirillum alkaliphilum DSM 21637 TaxID=1122209 RepID=A0A1K1UX81_9GAMM|nr:FapA family protein [Marinospirillum alkaliphilum]SFX17131.1 hypothetical protein SAMN02745752_00639 [Marinospirillum alkaliphilum DSM 21637]
MNNKSSPETTDTGLPPAVDLGISYDLRDNNELWATFVPVEKGRELTREQFAEVTLHTGYPPDDFPLIPANVTVLLDAVRRKEPRDACISIPEDARVDVFVSPSKLIAGMVLHGSKGRGKPVDRAVLDQALKKAKVVKGLLDDALEKLTSAKLAARLHNTENVYCTVVAYGEPHENGEDARLAVLVKDASDRRPREDEYGTIHYLDRGETPYIEPDTPLLRRHPPTKGKAGWNVAGKTLRAKDGKDIQFKLKDASVKLAEDDENLLLSATAGIPVLYDKGALVEEMLKVNQVDVESGHIRYKGSVEIKGDVRDGMQVVVTGDVKINGGVDAAYVQAGGHIEVIGGAIGHKDAQYLSEKAALKATCSVKARFAHEAMIEAGQEVLIGNQVMHTNIKSGGFVKVEGKGQVVGGRIEAVDYIEINTSGAVAYIETELVVGECQELQERYTLLLSQLNHLENQKYQLIELARKTRQQGRKKLLEMKDKLVRAKESLQAHQLELNTRLTLIEAELRRFYAAKVIVNRRAYPGTMVTIAGKSYEVTRELDKVTFFLQDDKVQIHQ